MEKLPNPSESLEFTEHQGIETDLTGLRAWNCWHENKQYAIWEVPRTRLPSYIAQLVAPGENVYLLNWRPYDPDKTALDWEPWQGVRDDCVDFESAVQAACDHALNTTNREY